MPGFGGFIGIVVALSLIFAIGPPIGYLATNTYAVTGQGIAVTFVLADIAGLLVTCPAVSRFTRQLKSKGPAVKALKRMNLLGLVRNVVTFLVCDHYIPCQAWCLQILCSGVGLAAHIHPAAYDRVSIHGTCTLSDVLYTTSSAVF